MIFNCLSCGKAISTHKSNCPYCRVNVSEVNEKLNNMYKPRIHNNVTEQLKGTILAVVHR